MDIEGLGEKQIVRFLELGYLTDFASIFALEKHKIQLIELDRMGEQSIANLLASIEAAKLRPLDRLLMGFGIRFVGTRTARDLAQRFRTLDAFLNADYESLIAIPDIGPRTASEVETWLESEENRRQIQEILRLGVVPQEVEATQEGVFSGKVVVFTGKLEKSTREIAESVVVRLGGKAAGTVSKQISLVVAGPGAGSKLKKAEELQISVITEDEFWNQVPPELQP